jgi:hypothetical protein
MEVIDGTRIYNKDLELLLTKPNHINDNKGSTLYSPDLLKSGSNVLHYVLPNSFEACIDACACLHNMTERSTLIRTCCVHGMSIYEFNYGCEIEAKLSDMMQARLSKNDTALSIYDSHIDAAFTNKRSVRVCDEFKEYIEIWGSHAGIPTQTFMGYLVLLSLRSHPSLNAWNNEIDTYICGIERHLRFKIKLLDMEM